MLQYRGIQQPFADVTQWQSVRFPSRIRGFDSRHLLQKEKVGSNEPAFSFWRSRVLHGSNPANFKALALKLRQEFAPRPQKENNRKGANLGSDSRHLLQKRQSPHFCEGIVFFDRMLRINSCKLPAICRETRRTANFGYPLHYASRFCSDFHNHIFLVAHYLIKSNRTAERSAVRFTFLHP